MKKYLQGKIQAVRDAVLLGSIMAAGAAHAVAPAYITNAMTEAETTFTEYLTAAAPKVFTIVVIVAGFLFVVKLIKKATH